MPDVQAELLFPTGGIDVSTEFEMQAPGTTQMGQNVRAFEPTTLRMRGGSRPGLSRYLPQLPNGPNQIQHLNIIVDPTTDATLDDDSPDDNAVYDPSNNPDVNHPRNPGRYVRNGGSGRQPNKNKKRTPKITWADPADINDYTPLTGTQLNATATDPVDGSTVSGTFVYTPNFGQRLTAGRYPLRTIFTPTDTGRYKVARKTVNIRVTTSGLLPFATVTYHGLVTSFPFSDSRAIVAVVLMSVNGGADITLGNSGVMTSLRDTGVVGQDTEIFWPDSTNITGTVPPYGYYYVSS